MADGYQQFSLTGELSEGKQPCLRREGAVSPERCEVVDLGGLGRLGRIQGHLAHVYPVSGAGTSETYFGFFNDAGSQTAGVRARVCGVSSVVA
eukprot:2835504-Rhodomonas_salina.1